jgi:predicted amidohydrolase
MLGLKVDNFKSFGPLSLEELRKIFDNFASIDDLCNNYVSKTIVDRFNKVVNRNTNIESEPEDSKVSVSPKLKEICVSKREKNVIRIATVQIDYELSSSFPFEIKNKNETYSKIHLALEKAKEKNCDIICFPELSFCEEWLPEIKDKYSSMIIIAGSHYNNNKNNICQIFFGPDNFISSQLKIKPSASEEEIYAKRMVPGESVNIYESKFGTFAVLICRDFPHYVRYLRNKVDIIFVPSSNKELENFYSAAQDHVIHSPSYVIISNSSQYGGTSLFGIEDRRIFDQLVEAGYKSKNDNTYNLCEFKKEKEDIIIEGMIIADLNLAHKTLQKPTPVNPQDEIKPVKIIDMIYF